MSSEQEKKCPVCVAVKGVEEGLAKVPLKTRKDELCFAFLLGVQIGQVSEMGTPRDNSAYCDIHLAPMMQTKRTIVQQLLKNAVIDMMGQVAKKAEEFEKQVMAGEAAATAANDVGGGVRGKGGAN